MVFWGKSCDSSEIFLLQKKVTRIMAGCQRTKSRRELLGRFLHVYPLGCLQYGSDVIVIMVSNVIQALFTEDYALR
jgi:hypothetical protein